MSHRHGAPLVADAHCHGTGGLGVLGSEISSAGTNGPGYAYNDLDLPDDAGKEIRGLITQWPSAGTLTAYEDTSFTFDGPDGTYTAQYQLYVDGVAVGGPATITLQRGGVATHDAGGDVAASSVAVSGAASRSRQHAATGAISAAAADVAGAASRTRVHASTGALQASAAAVSGDASRRQGTVSHASSGAIVASAAGVSGSATIAHVAHGALQAGAAIVSGAASRSPSHASAGGIVSGSALIAAAASRRRVHPSTAAATAGSAAVAGAAKRAGAHSSSGAVAAGAAVVSGQALHTNGAIDISLMGGKSPCYMRVQKHGNDDSWRFWKQPAEVLDYDLDFADFIDGTGDTILAVAAVSDGLYVAGYRVDGNVVKVVLGGGETNEIYKTTVRVTTKTRVREVDFVVSVKDY